MIYTRPEYAVLLLLTLLLYFATRSKAIRFQVLMIVSLIFYGWAGIFDFLIFILVIGFSYLSVFLAEKYPRWRNAFLTSGVTVLILHLLGWKYLPWAARGVGSELNLPLPLGISFFTLQGVGYLIDVWRREIPLMKLREFVLFKSFFPQLIAGPIIRGSDMWTWLKEMPNPRREQIVQGLYLIGLGFVKKMIIADYLGIFADGVFSNPASLDRATLWLGAICFYVQIWGDFSGYTDIGRGSALLFGLKLPENFFSTLYAHGGTDWSRRWHSTLQTWVRDYLYFPLTQFLVRVKPRMLPAKGYELGAQIFGKYFAAMIVALWHGAALNFFIWGLCLWVIATVESLMMMVGLIRKNPSWRRRLFDTLVMMQVFYFTGVFFRCTSLENLHDFLHGLFIGNENPVSFVWLAGPVFWRLGLAYLIDGITYYNMKTKTYVVLAWAEKRIKPWLEANPSLGYALAGMGAALLMVTGIAFRSNDSLNGFIYFRF